MHNIGINTNCNCGKNYKETLENIKKSGIKNLMVAFTEKDKEEKYLKTAVDLGFNICFVHLSVEHADETWTKGGVHDSWYRLLKHELDLCHKYGVKTVIFHPTVGNPAHKVISPNPSALKDFEDFAKYAKELNIKIAVENLDNNSYEHFMYILDNVKLDNVGWCYDVGHHNLYGKDIDVFKLYGNRLFAVHLHDNLGNYEYGDDYSKDLHLLPFDGNIDYARITHEIANADYSDVIMIETHKKIHGEPKLYEQISVSEFLNEAKKRAERLIELISNARKL